MKRGEKRRYKTRIKSTSGENRQQNITLVFIQNLNTMTFFLTLSIHVCDVKAAPCSNNTVFPLSATSAGGFANYKLHNYMSAVESRPTRTLLFSCCRCQLYLLLDFHISNCIILCRMLQRWGGGGI